MSIEQWGVLALVVLLPLLQGVARLRRARIDNHVPPGDGVGRPPAARRGTPPPNRSVTLTAMGVADTFAARSPLALPPPLPSSPAAAPAVPPAASRANQRPFASSRFRDAQRPLSADTVVRWLRPTRNLRRAIIVATILGPRPQ